MRVFLAGATGVIGRRLVPLMLAEGHVVAGMTRNPDSAGALDALGAQPVVCDAYDADALTRHVVGFAPDLVMSQLTDLPDDAREVRDYYASGAIERIRLEGGRNLLDAATAAGARGFVFQSIAFEPIPRTAEEPVLAAGGTVLRYGRFYGPDTYDEQYPQQPPRIHVDDAARRTMEFLASGLGIIEIVESPPPTEPALL